jgi:thermitase
VKVLEDGTGSLEEIAAGIRWAADNGADVINLSLGGPTNIPAIDMAVSYATSHNVVVVAAAGNDGSTSPSYPAGVVGTIAVGASDPAAKLYDFSNRGAGWVDVAAPGCNTASGSGTPSAFCGTSSAAPLTAGIVGLLRSAKPTLGASTIRAALETSAKPLASGGLVARGIVDAQAALSAITAAAGGTAPWVAKIDASKPTGAIADQGLYVSGITTTTIQTKDNVGVVSVRLFADGSMVGSATPGAGGRATVTWFTGWKDGPVNLRATMVDAAGNSASTPGRVVRVDNRAPSLLLFEPGNEARVGPRFSVSVAAFDANDVLMTLVAVDGKIVGGSRGQGTFRFDAATPRSGRLQVVAASVDHAGHISFSNVITVNAKVKAARRRR